MIGLEYDGSFPPTTMSDEALGVDEFASQQANRPFQLPLNQEGVDDLLLNGSYEQLPAQQQQAAAPILPPVHVVPVSTIPAASSSISSSFVSVAAASPSWDQAAATNGNKRHAPVERETKVKKRKQQHQLKDKERRHRINDGLKQLGNLVQGATGSFTRLDQPTIVSSSISLIKQLQAELNMLRSQLAGQKPTTKDVKEEKFVSKPAADSRGHYHADGACPVFSSVAGAGVGLIMIRADDLSIVEANSVLFNILGYASAVEFVGTPVWDAPLHSRLYQLDAHGRIVNDNSNPFAFGASQPKVKLEGQDGAVVEEEQHIDCLWTAHTANGNMLSAKVTLSVLKGDDAKPTHFMLCSLPSHRSVSPLQPSVSAFPTTSMPAEVEVAC